MKINEKIVKIVKIEYKYTLSMSSLSSTLINMLFY